MVCPYCHANRVKNSVVESLIHCTSCRQVWEAVKPPARRKDKLSPITARPVETPRILSPWLFGLGPGLKGGGWINVTA